MPPGYDSAAGAAGKGSPFNIATAASNSISPSPLEKRAIDSACGCFSAGRAIRRATEVLAALLGLFAAIFFSCPASAQGQSLTGIFSSLNPIGFGKLVTFDAFVAGTTPPCRNPTGTVTFLIDGSSAGTVGLLGSGDAFFNTGTLAIGAHTVVAQYNGDSNCQTSSRSLLGGQVVFSRTAHDFNGDRKSDILWRDTNGNTALWLMNGAAVLSSVGSARSPGH
jgi:Bacterial Ig-like domain (group 3)